MTFECSQIKSKTCMVNAGCLINLAFQLQIPHLQLNHEVKQISIVFSAVSI